MEGRRWFIKKRRLIRLETEPDRDVYLVHFGKIWDDRGGGVGTVGTRLGQRITTRSDVR